MSNSFPRRGFTMILVLHSTKLDKPIEVELPEDWHSALLNYQMDLGHKTLNETVNHLLKEYIDNHVKTLDESNPPTGGSGVPDLVKKERRHEEFQEAAKGREQIYKGLKDRSKKI
jgi:hypothetical protein